MNDMSFAIAPEARPDDLPRTLRHAKVEKARRDAEAAPPVRVVISGVRMAFFPLVGLFFRVALAAIPAIVLLAFVFVGIGEAMDWLLPDWIKMQVIMSAR